jgi:hypothetical protein
MADGDWSGEIFSLDGKLRPAATDVRGRVVVPEDVAPTDDPYSPYGAAWKEFDKLQKLAKNSGPFAWAHWAWGVFSSVAGTARSASGPQERLVGVLCGFRGRRRIPNDPLATRQESHPALAVPALPRRMARE